MEKHTEDRALVEHLDVAKIRTHIIHRVYEFMKQGEGLEEWCGVGCRKKKKQGTRFNANFTTNFTTRGPTKMTTPAQCGFSSHRELISQLTHTGLGS